MVPGPAVPGPAVPGSAVPGHLWSLNHGMNAEMNNYCYYLGYDLNSGRSDSPKLCLNGQPVQWYCLWSLIRLNPMDWKQLQAKKAKLEKFDFHVCM